MATSLNAQLRVIKSVAQVSDSDSRKRPITRPSILYDAQKAADIDIDTIYENAVTGLEGLVYVDERFRNYRNDLFSIKSKELDREQMNEEENKNLNSSIASYLRLLSGHLELEVARKTLEYLIRRYKIYVHNTEDLILCALPYHDTLWFVKLIQLVETRDGKWKFLEGVQKSGARLPRSFLVQQCLCDLGVLETICIYACSSKNPAKPVICFCTALVIEALGSSTGINNDVVKRILRFVDSGLQAGGNVLSDHKAGSLMIVGLLASKVALSPKLVNKWLRTIAGIAQQDAMEPTELQWVRLSMLTLISLVQTQAIEMIPRNTLQILKETRDMHVILVELSKECNIDRFLDLLLDSLIECSLHDESYHHALAFIIEKVPIKKFINRMVLRILSRCLKVSERNVGTEASDAGGWANKVLMVIHKNYPVEFQQAVRMFLEDGKVQDKKNDTVLEILNKILEGNLDLPAALSESKILFGLQHPKAAVRRATLSNLGSSGILKVEGADLQRLVNIKDAIFRQLHDDDLTVVQAALSIEGLPEMLSSADILKALDHVLKRCVRSLKSGAADDNTLACDVVCSFIKNAISSFHDQINNLEELASLLFPLLLISPKTQTLNLRVLRLAKEVEWPLYHNIPYIDSKEVKLERESISSLNLKIVSNLGEAISSNNTKYMPWVIRNCKNSDNSRTLSFLIVMEALLKPKTGMEIEDFSAMFEACFSFLRAEWMVLEASGSLLEFNEEMLDWDGRMFLDQLFSIGVEELNTKILISLFWRILDALISVSSLDILSGDNRDDLNRKFKNLFVFFATTPAKDVFKKHLCHLVTNCKTSPIDFLSGFLTEEDVPLSAQLESLHCFSLLCAKQDDGLPLQLLTNSPLPLVSLSSGNQDLRIAAMACIEALSALSRRVDFLSKKNGNNSNWIKFVELLDLIVQQKRLILSDKNFLPSFFTSLLGSSSGGLLVPQNVEHRFSQSTKGKILAFILGYGLKLPTYGKVMILSLLKGLGSKIMQIRDSEELLSQLLKRRRQYYLEGNQSCQNFCESELKILCLLLEISATGATSNKSHHCEDHLLSALRLDGSSSEEAAVLEPCITVLNSIDSQFYSGLTSEKQELLFRELLLLFRHTDGRVQNASREALLRLKIVYSTVALTLDFIQKRGGTKTGSSYAKKKKREATPHQAPDSDRDLLCKEETLLPSLSSLLDILLLKKVVAQREFLLGPLFQLLERIFFDGEIVALGEKWIEASSGISQTMPNTILYIQQTLLIVLEDIISSLECVVPLKDDISNRVDVEVLIKCAHSAKEGVTRNHVFSLLCSIANVMPDKIVRHVLDILAVIGESTVTQTDSHSQHVFEQLISAIVPCWLAKTEDPEKLLQIFMNVIPEIAEYRRLSVVVYLLRVLGEQSSLASLLLLLFQSLLSRRVLISLANEQAFDAKGSIWREWEYAFALQIVEQYSSTIWLPSLVILIKRIRADDSDQELPVKLLFAMEFILHKLQDPEFTLRLQSSEGFGNIQGTLQELMEDVVTISQLVDARRKQFRSPAATRKVLKERVQAVLRTIRTAMTPSAYFSGMINLLGNSDDNVQKKALRLLCGTLRNQDSEKIKHKGRETLIGSSSWVHTDKAAVKYFHKMCLQIVGMVDTGEEADPTLPIAAVSTLEVLAHSFPSNPSVFSACLPCVTKAIRSSNLAMSSSSLRTTGALIEVLGPKALIELPNILGNMMVKCGKVSSSTSEESFMLAILVTLEQVIDKLGGFLNPYLGDILELLVIHPMYTSLSHEKLKLRADLVRSLLTEKIPVRLALPPLLKIQSDAVKSGDCSVSAAFEILARLIQAMDKSSVRGYHEKIFDLCLSCLDLRHQHPDSIQHIDAVEKSVINATVALSMKLTETMFKPLFIRSIEWAESGDEGSASTTVDRAISFYGLVNKLADSHRSLFVPYFKYLLAGCESHLKYPLGGKTSTQKKKKAKIQVDGTNGDVELSLKIWHVRALVLSALHKCFQYDTGNLKFLDSNSFQTLLKSIASQFDKEPPTLLQSHPDVPSLEEVDNLLVETLGQMAVSARSDLLWKPLNHEVLMQTRADKIRPKILGLRTVKYLLDNLKEEYLVFVPETLQFFVELLEDVNLSVKTLAQDVFKEMETVGGESLEQYLGL
ncbi:unnamed protein product [Linum trigynum]|uniref:BP28 C-terminal domain-containing protein n=1 Tax=Linum trigynum TaxID=586398 RepID=A0AAV2EYW5_9ROSI